MRSRDALAEARRVTHALRVSPPRNTPDISRQLDRAERALDHHGAEPALAERYHDPIAGLELLVKRLREDGELLTKFADLIAGLDGIASAVATPGRAAARDVAAPPTPSGQVREARPEPPSRPE